MKKDITTCYYRIKNEECLKIELYRGRVKSFEVIKCPDWFLKATPPSPKPIRPISAELEREYIKASKEFIEAIKKGDTVTAMKLWFLYKDIIICYLEE